MGAGQPAGHRLCCCDLEPLVFERGALDFPFALDSGWCGSSACPGHRPVGRTSCRPWLGLARGSPGFTCELGSGNAPSPAEARRGSPSGGAGPGQPTAGPSAWL